MELAAAADAGFDRELFAEVLGALPQFTDRDFDLYGVSQAELDAMRVRFAEWRGSLKSSG